MKVTASRAVAHWFATVSTIALLTGLATSGSTFAQVIIENGETINVPSAGQSSPWVVPGNGDLTLGRANGDDGTGHLNIYAGGVVESRNGTVHGVDGLESTVSVGGAGAIWRNSENLVIASHGTASLTIRGGGRVENITGIVGQWEGANGVVDVTGAGSTWANSGGLFIGLFGNGTLNITNGGRVENGNAAIGLGSVSGIQAVGIVTVNGAGSIWATSGSLEIAQSGRGTLNIEAGGRVESTSGLIGSLAGSSGTANVTGTNSIWSVTNQLTVGWVGNGAVTVSAGGHVEVGGALVLGGAAGSTGTMTVTGEGSLLKMTQSMSVGIDGIGTLVIADKGRVENTYTYIDSPTASGSSGLVTGIGSEWFNSGSIHVGDQGAGTLTVADGGKVRASSLILATAGSASGTLNLNGTTTARGVLETAFIRKRDGEGAVNFDGGILRATEAADLIRGFLPGQVTIRSGGAFIDSSTFNVSIGSPLGGDGALTKQGVSTLTLTAANTYAGGTIIEAGTLKMDGAGTLGAPTGALAIAGSAALDLGGTSQTVGALSGAGLVTSRNQGTNLLTVNQATDTIFSGAFEEGYDTLTNRAVPISLTKTGTGRLTLTGSNYTTGATIIDGGELRIEGSTISATTVNNGGTLSGNGIIAATVTVASGGILAGASGSTLTMDHLTLQAGSSVNVALGAPGSTALFNVRQNLTLDGTLNVTNAGGFGAGVYRIADYGGTLTDNGLDVGSMPTGTRGTIQTAVASQVNLIVEGAVAPSPTIQFWNGTTTVADGTIHGGSGRWSMGPVTNWTDANGGEAQAHAGTFAVFQNNPGTVTVDGSAGAVRTGGMQFIGSGWQVSGDTLTLAGANGETVVRVGNGAASGASDSATIAAVLTGASRLVKDDLGTLTLTADNSYTGGTEIRNGTLAVNGSIAGTLDVLSAGRLQGTGTVGNTIVAGTIAPGNSIGTLNVAGTITFNPGSIYEVEVNAAGQGDRIAATGTATINGGSVRVLAGAGTYAPSTRYTILTADGGRTGTFGSVASNFAFLDPSLSYDADSVYLTLTRNQVSFANVGITRNQRSTGSGIESLGAGNPVWNAVVQFDAPTARHAFDQLSGEIHASARTVLIEESRFLRTAVNDRIRSAFDGVGAAAGTVTTYVGGRPVLVPANTDRLAVWGQGFGSWGQTGGDGNAARLNRSTGGFFIGADAAVFDSWRLGAVAGYSRTSFSVRDRRSSGSSDTYHLGLYGGTQWGNLGLRTGAAYSWHTIATGRSIVVPGLGDSLRSDYNAATAQVFGELAYGFAAGPARFEPFAGLAYVHLGTDGFCEQGRVAALAGASSNTDATFTTLGLRASTSLALGGGRLTARGMLGWRHAFGDVTPIATQRFATGGSPFAVWGVPIARNAAVLEAGLDYTIMPSATLGLSYNAQFGSSTSDQSVRASFQYRF